MKLFLVLGCWGKQNNNFVLCSSTQNIILDLTKNNVRNSNIINYLDHTLRLFDKPLYANVHTAIWNINEKFSEADSPVFEENLFKNIEKFCIEHVHCGLFLRLELRENE